MQLNERTASYLAQEVQKAQSEFDAANAAVREAEARRDAIRLKLEAMQRVLGPGSPAGSSKHVNGAQKDLLASTKHPSQSRIPTGFRDAVRHVMSESQGKGMSSREVWERLSERGIVYTGSLNAVIRTGNELRRLARLGQLRKRQKKYYSVKANDAEAVTT